MQHSNYHENRQRGTTDFPVEFHHVDKYHPHYSMPYHWHAEFELIRILEGTFTIAIEEKVYTAVKGSTIMIPHALLHSGSPHDCIYECAVFDMNLLLKDNDGNRKYIKQITNHQLEVNTYFDPSYHSIHQTVWLLFDALIHKKMGYQMLVRGSLYQLLGIILAEGYYSTNPSQTTRVHKRMTQLKHVLEYIEENYASPITLEDLAGSAGMSRKYFCRFFLEMTHHTAFEYLNHYRIERACYQFATTDSSVTEVAFNCGFNDLSYFIKTFKKYKQTTPKKYYLENR